MRCKQGDLAIIFQDFDGCEGYLGLIVKVVGSARAHPDTEMICWYVAPLSRRKLWLIDKSGTEHVFISKMLEAMHPDPWLLPIRGQDTPVVDTAELIEFI